jgi:muconolactone delta-isomerase
VTVLFMVQMEVRLPPEMEADDPKARERARSQELQRDVRVFDVGSPDELHKLHELHELHEQPAAVPVYRRARDSASASPVQARFNRLRRRGD